MFRTLLCTCLLLLLLVFVSIALSPQFEQADFVYGAASELNTLDPAQMSWTQDVRVAINIWEGLTSYHPQTLEPVEGAAYFPPNSSTNGLIYEFTLRPDARWCNGEAVTAGDFLRGWRRAVEPGTARDYTALLIDHIAGLREYYDWRNRMVGVLRALSRLAEGRPIDAAAAQVLYEQEPHPPGDWARIHSTFLHRHAAECEERFARVGLEVINDSTLRVTLQQPCPYFLDLCAFPAFMPIHESIELLRERFADVPLTKEGLVVYDSQWTKPGHPPGQPVEHSEVYPGLITNGPYRLVEWSFKRRLRLDRNPYYRDRDRITCATIDRVVYSDANTAVMAYEAGQVDFLPDMKVHYDHRLIELATRGLRPDFHNPLILATHFYIFNCREAEVLGRPNPFTDARVRRAFTLAVDKRLLVEKVLARGEPVSGNLVPVGAIPGYATPAPLSFDPTEARRLLAEAGHPGGERLPPIDLLYSTAGGEEKTCQVLARMWQDTLGVRVELRGKEAKTFAEDKVNRRYMIAQAGWYGDYNDPTTFLDIFRSDNGNNDAGYANPVYDELLDGAAGPGPQGAVSERLALLAQAEALLIREDCPLLSLYQLTNLMAIQPYVQRLYPNPRLIYPFRYVRVNRP